MEMTIKISVGNGSQKRNVMYMCMILSNYYLGHVNGNYKDFVLNQIVCCPIPTSL